ncbi:MAG: type II toxin-antitoxin system VapC family toxin [Anaerolineales bacterium]
MGDTYVLDSYAVLVVLGGEPGSDEVRTLLQGAEQGNVTLHMNWVNVGEVAYIVERRWGKEKVYQAVATLQATAVKIAPVGQALALRAAAIKAEHPLAYADAFAAALAMETEGTLVTGDPEFGRLEKMLRIQWLSRE